MSFLHPTVKKKFLETLFSSSFLSTFSAHIAEVDEKNGGIDSFSDMMRHYFADREKEALETRKILEKNGAPKSAIASVPVKKCLTQADITHLQSCNQRIFFVCLSLC